MTKSKMIEKLAKEITDNLKNIAIHELPEGKEYNVIEYDLEFSFKVDGQLVKHTQGAYIGK